jgi:16S rRNA (uracil1498-N3)-methyltransferase
LRRLFLTPAQLASETVTISGADAHHLLNVLRVRAGERLLLLDGLGGAWHAEVLDTGKRELTARRLEPAAVAPEPVLHLTVAQALGKGDKFEQVIQHGTEVGAAAFIPLHTERGVVRVDAKSADAKRERWTLIAKGAAEQSGRAVIPSVEPPASFSALLPRLGEFDAALLLHPEGEDAAPLLRAEARAGRRWLLMVGPEGGFSPAEVEQARGAGAWVASLGEHILRTETAALIAAAQVLFAARVFSGDGEEAGG